MIQLTRRTDGQSGIQSLLEQRGSMQNWSHLKTLLNYGSNREAAAIVQSFENQMQEEQSYQSLDFSFN
jgi:hypothetical protein